MTLYRVLHDIEIGRPIWRHDVPEVSHGDPSPVNPETGKRYKEQVKITPRLRALIKGINAPYLTDKRLTVLLGHATAFTNTNPSVIDKPRLCGGAVVEGEERDGVVWIKAIDATKPLPSVSYVLAHPRLFFRCVIVKQDGRVIDFPHCTGADKIVHPVYWPVIANGGYILVHTNPIPGKPYIALARYTG